jgi:hypothetical protein
LRTDNFVADPKAVGTSPLRLLPSNASSRSPDGFDIEDGIFPKNEFRLIYRYCSPFKLPIEVGNDPTKPRFDNEIELTNPRLHLTFSHEQRAWSGTLKLEQIQPTDSNGRILTIEFARLHIASCSAKYKGEPVGVSVGFGEGRQEGLALG